MHVILKPFIKLLIWGVIFSYVAQLAGVDVESLLGDAKESLEGLLSEQEAEE